MVDRQDVAGHDHEGADAHEDHRRAPEPGVDHPPEENAGAEDDRQAGRAEADRGRGDALHQELTRVLNVAPK